jgi:DNA-binding protein H-NS
MTGTPPTAANAAFAIHSATVNAADVRVATLDGRPHVVAPVVAVTDGILKGDYLPAEEIDAAAAAFNGVPLPIGHPTDGRGNYVTANTPERVARESVGRLFDARADDGALKGEVWLDVDKSLRRGGADDGDPEYAAPLALLHDHLSDTQRDELGEALSAYARPAAHAAVDDVDAVLSAAREQYVADSETPDVLEVSTAYWYTADRESGVHDGTQYDAVQRDLRPDHLALLPNDVGECSVEDGCGVPRTNADGTTGDGDDPDGPDAHHDHDTTSDADRSLAVNATDRVRTAITNLATACGCGALVDTDNEDDTTMTLEDLAAATGVDKDTLADMSEDERDALASLADADADGTTDDGQAGSTDEPETNSTDDDSTGDSVPDEVAETLSALQSEVSDLREQVNEAEQAERAEHIETITANSTLSEEQAASMDTEALEALAADVAAPDMRAAAGVRGRQAAPAHNSDDGADLDAARDTIAALSGGATADSGGEN